jgi:hypothetical protein
MSNQSTNIGFKKYLTEYLLNPNPDLKELTKSQIHLKQFRKTTVDNFDINKSRILHMSVLLYKFKEELDVGEFFWKIVRTMILAVLTNNPDQELSIDDYFKYFEIWKNNDINKLIIETASIYYNILETKKSLENSGYSNLTQNSFNEEIVHIDKTLDLIKTQSIKINIFDKVLEVIQEITNAKTNLIRSVVIKAYWDKIEADIENKHFKTVLDNLAELKKQMKLILPKSEQNKPNYILDECMDINFFDQLITHNVFDDSNVRSILNIVYIFVKEWDSCEYKKIHDDSYNKIIKLIDSVELSKSLRIVLEHCTELVSDFILRKELWTKILKSTKP